MDDEVITVSGLRELQKALYSYSKQLGDRVVISALRQGAGVVRTALKQAVPVKTGNLKNKGFTVKRSKIHRGQLSSDTIGVYLTLRKTAYYGRFQNDGFTAGSTKVPGKHFVQETFNRTKETALRVIISDAQAGADVLARKVGL